MDRILKLITDSLREHYGLEITALELLTIGADLNASVYRAETVDRKVYFIKIRRGPVSKAHLEVMTLLQQAGVTEIIAPIKTKEGEAWQTVEEFTLVVYPFIVGQDGFSRSLTDLQWRQFGKTLRQIHEIEVPKSVQKHIRIESFSPKWREAVRFLYTRPEMVDDNTPFKRLLKEKKEVIEQLLNRSEKHSKRIEMKPSSFVLCHSDIHAGNLLLEKEDIFYLVDWDDPIMAPKERDLMFIGGGVGNAWNQPREETLFFEGYGKTDINRDLLAYYRHERILEDVVEFAQELLLNEGNGQNRAVMYGHFAAMFDPEGVVDIALKM